MSNDFTNLVKNWVRLDNELKQLNERLKNLREQKNTINNNVISYVETNNLNGAIINISDGQIKFYNSKTTNTLTFKFVEECLSDIIDNKEEVSKIIEYIKQKRNIKSFLDIKRIYNN